MAVPNNAASALEQLLWALTRSGANQFGRAWAGVLDCSDFNTVEFVRRHSAVVELVSEIQTFLEALPQDDELRQRHLSDMPTYYGAVVWHGDWNAQINTATLVNEASIRLLGGLGDVMKYRHVAPEVTEHDLTKLRESLQHWETMLDETTLPEGIAAEIRSQLATIHDLLGQADKLGYGPVVKEAESLLGKALRLAKVVENADKIATCVTTLFEFITHLQVREYGQATNVLVGAFSMMGEAIEAARQERIPQKAIGRSRQRELEAGPSGTVDAEVIDEHEPNEDEDDDAPESK